MLEDKPEPFVPKRARSEAEQDRLEALTLFSTARLFEQRNDPAKALRLYERAFRYDPQSKTIAQAVVQLAVGLDRPEEARRYALKGVELGDQNPRLLKFLGVYLTEIGDWPRAVALFEKADATRQSGKPGAEDVALWMEMGRLYYLTEKYDKAADAFARVIKALEHPDDFGLDDKHQKELFGGPGLTWNMIGESFFLAGRFTEAAAAFEKANQAAPNKGLLSYQLARIDARTGKPERALERLQACFDARLSDLRSAESWRARAGTWLAAALRGPLGPVLTRGLGGVGLPDPMRVAVDLAAPSEGAGPYRLLAELLNTLHRQSELILRLEALRAGDPANAALAYFLAEEYLKANQSDKAEPIYRALVAKAPSIAAYRDLLEIYRKAKRYDALLNVLGEAIGHAGSLEPLADKGHALADDKELVEKVLQTARQQLKTGAKGFPFESRLAAAVLALDAKQYDAAAEFYDAAIQAEPDQAARLLLGWGLGLSLREQPARAVEVFRRGVAQKALPAGDPTFHYYLAGALELAGRTDEALAVAQQAVQLASTPKSAGKPAQAPLARRSVVDYQARVAWILYHAKRYEAAARAYGELIQRHASDYDSADIREVLREARLVMSNIAVFQHDNARAVEWLEQALDEFPDDAGALNDLGYLWAEQGKHLERARRMIEQAVQEEPENAAYRDSLGWVLFQQGHIKEAVPELEKAAAMEPDAAVLDHLGDAYRAVGEPGKAKDAWRRAVDAFKKAGSQEELKKVEDKIKKLEVRS
jgi:tetratricopeptide (TPR) repeat protein